MAEASPGILSAPCRTLKHLSSKESAFQSIFSSFFRNSGTEASGEATNTVSSPAS